MGALNNTDYIGYVVELTIPANMLKPPADLVCDIDLIGDPESGVTDSDIKYYGGSDGNPADDTSPMGGAISTGAELVEGTTGTLIQTCSIAASDQTYRGCAYRKNEDGTNDWNNAAFTNRAGGNQSAISDVFEVYSTSASDTDDLYLSMISGSAWVEEYVTMTGTSHVTSANAIDASAHWVAQYGNGAIPVGDIYLKVNSIIVGVIYGSTGGNGNYMASSLYRIAVKTTKNSTISAADRKTDPASISAYTRATYWPGNDSSLAVP